MAVAPSKTAYVAPTATLNLTNNHWLCCSRTNMWQGIVLNATATQTARLSITNNSLIEDAIKAVKLVGGIVPGAGNLITLDGAILNRNSIGLDIENFPTSYPTAIFPATYPFLVRNSVFTSRAFSVLNDGSGLNYPLTWPALTGTSTALKANWTSGDPMVPSYNILSPTGAGTVSGGYGGRYNPIRCKDGSRANIGIQLLNTGGSTTWIGNAPQSFAGVVIGDNTVAGNSNPYLNLFDTLMEGVYAQYSNFTCYNNTFMYMYQPPVAPTYPLLAGDGIGAVATPSFGSLALAYPHNSMEVSGGLTPVPSRTNKFYDCRRGVNSYGYYYVTCKNTEMYSRHTATYPTGQFGCFITTPFYYDIEVTDNVLTNLVTGISMTASVVTTGSLNQYLGIMNISNNTIQSTYGGGMPAPTEFTNLGISVSNAFIGSGIASYTALSGIAHTDNNNMQYVYNGINVTGFNDQILESGSNTIRLMRNGVVPATQAGISHTNCANTLIDNNTIIGPGFSVPAPVAGALYGLLGATGASGANPMLEAIFSSANVNTLVTCNFTGDINTGFRFTGANPNSWKDNVMNNNAYGMVIQGTFGPQTATGTPCGNDWHMSSATSWTGLQFNTWTLNGIPPTPNTLFVIPNIGTEVYNPAHNRGNSIAPGNWYGGGAAAGGGAVAPGLSMIDPGANPTCVAKYLAMTPLPLLPIVKHTEYFAAVGAAQNWIAQNKLYLVLQNEPGYLDAAPELAQFNTMAATSRYAWLAQIENAIIAGDAATANTLMADGIDAHVNTDLDALTGVTMADDVAADNIVTNYLTLYQTYLNYAGNGLSEQDNANLLAIANLCPFTDGDVVYKARAFYRMVSEDATTVFPELCGFDTTGDSIGQRRALANAAPEHQQYTLFPNPNNGSFMLQQLVADNKQVQVEVRDLLGRLVYDQTVVFGGKNVTVNLKHAQSGVYLVRVLDGNNATNFKITIE